MRLLSIFFFSFFCFSLHAQIDPVSWTYSIEQLEDNSYDVHFTATMDSDWVIYSQHTDSDGPIPTSFQFENEICLNGEVEEQSKALKLYSDLFMVEVIKFKKEAIFVQNIKADCLNKFEASIEYMTCDGERCLPPKEVVLEVMLN